MDKATAAIIAAKPDAVVITNRISAPALGQTRETSYDAYAQGWTDVLKRFSDAGLKVMVVRDTPASGKAIPDCVAQHERRRRGCDGTRTHGCRENPPSRASRTSDDPDIHLIDLTDHICEKEVCHAVTGGVITYFDSSHLTATYARTLAPYLGRPLSTLLAR